MSKAIINSPQEIREYIGFEGAIHSVASQPEKPTVIWGQIEWEASSSSVITLDEGAKAFGRVGTLQVRFSLPDELSGSRPSSALAVRPIGSLPAGFAIANPTVVDVMGVADSYEAIVDVYFAPSTGDYVTEKSTIIHIVGGNPVWNHETTPVFNFDLRFTLPSTSDLHESIRDFHARINVGNVLEAPVRLLPGPVAVVVNLRDSRPNDVDLSSYFGFRDPPSADPATREDWELYVVTRFGRSAVVDYSLTPGSGGKSLRCVPRSTTTPGTGRVQVAARNKAMTSLNSGLSYLQLNYTFERGLYPTSISWTDTAPAIPGDVADWVEDGNVYNILLNPGSDGSTTAINLGSYIAAATSDGAVGVLSYALRDFQITEGSQSYTVSDVAYNTATNRLTFGGAAIEDGTAFEFKLRANVAQSADSAVETSDLIFRIRVGYKPVITFGSWETLSQLPENTSGRIESVDLARISYQYTGVPDHIATGDFIVPSWTTETTDGAFRMETASGNSGELVYYGHGRSRADATRFTVTPSLTLRQVAGDVHVESATKAAPPYTVHIVPPPPVFKADSYEFEIDDGRQPSTINERSRAIGRVETILGDGYVQGPFVISKNSSDTNRQFGIDSDGYIYFTGALAISLALAKEYDLTIDTSQRASDDDVSPAASVNVKIKINAVASDSVILNPDWRPDGGLSRSIIVGGTTEIDASNGWRVPEGSIQSISGVVAPLLPTAFISSADTDDVFTLTGLAIGTATFTISNDVTLPDGSKATNVPTISVTVEVHSAFVPTPYKWLQRGGVSGAYTYTEVDSVSVSIAENSASTELFTDSRIYFWCPDLQNRSVSLEVADDTDSLYTLDDAVEVIPIPGITGNQTAHRIRPTVDGTRLNFENLHRYSVRIEVHAEADTDSSPEYGAFTEYLPIVASITDVNELPMRRTDTPFPDLTVRRLVVAPPIRLDNRWSDPEGRTLNFEVTTSNKNIVSGSLIDFGTQWQPQYNRVGTATITVRANDGTTPTRWVQDTFTITVEATLSELPEFEWVNPTDNIDVFSNEDIDIGTKLYRNIWARSITDDTTATLGEITYSLGPAGDQIPPDVSDLDAETLLWLPERSQWWIGGTIDGAGNPQQLRVFDKNGDSVAISGASLKPSYYPSQDGVSRIARSEITEFMDVTPYPVPNSGGINQMLCVGRGQFQIKRGGRTNTGQGSGIYAQLYALLTPPEPPQLFSIRTFHIQFNNTVYSLVVDWDGTNASSIRVWATKQGDNVVRAYNAGGAANEAAAAEDVASGFTPANTISDQPQAMRLNHAGDVIYVVCRKGTNYTIRAWNWPARTRAAELDVGAGIITGKAVGMHVAPGWIYVLHYTSGETDAMGRTITVIPIGA